MFNPVESYHAHKRKQEITFWRARERSLKGWETRRKGNAHLRNIDYEKKSGNYTWHRPNGEHVPLKDFNHDQVELMAPGFTAVDKHVKKNRRLHTEIKGHPMRLHNFTVDVLGGGIGRTGAYAHPTRTYDPEEIPGSVKTILKWSNHIDRGSWGKHNNIVVNKKALNQPDTHMHPTGIIVHELGHINGPGDTMRFGPHYPNQKGRGKKAIEKFENHFDWEAPRFKAEKDGFHFNRKGSLVPELTDYAHSHWQMKDTHPGSTAKYTSGPQKGLAVRKDNSRYANSDPWEDFAENFRHNLGVPLSIDDHMFDKKGKVKPKYEKSRKASWFTPADPKGSRRKYLLDEHLASAASNPRQYRGDLAQITTKNKKRKVAEDSRRTKARQHRINKLTRGVFY